MVASLMQADFEVWDIAMQDLLQNRATLDQFKGIVFPGGFSYAGNKIYPHDILSKIFIHQYSIILFVVFICTHDLLFVLFFSLFVFLLIFTIKLVLILLLTSFRCPRISKRLGSKSSFQPIHSKAIGNLHPTKRHFQFGSLQRLPVDEFVGLGWRNRKR